MRVLITGICGFVGSHVAAHLKGVLTDLEIIGVDNLVRRGSETNISLLRGLGCQVVHGDLRVADDVVDLPRCDWVIDCAALPSVLAGVNGGTAQLVGHNLVGTLHLLEKCRRDGAGFVILSSSRVYSIDVLNAIPLTPGGMRFAVDETRSLPAGCSKRGIAETFSTAAPVSLYGGTKLASETMALEYSAAFGFPLWIDRCGVIAGPGQFGRIDQGVFSYWIYQWQRGKPLAYIGFGGEGRQVRDFIAPKDLNRLLEMQLRNPDRKAPKIVNVGGGPDRSMSLWELSTFCQQTMGPAPLLTAVPETRPYDIPYFVTDSAVAERAWAWRPEEQRDQTLESIVRWARDHRELLDLFAG